MSTQPGMRNYLNGRMQEIATGVRGAVTSVPVELPDGTRADVAIKVHYIPDILIASGVVRYDNGRVIGERHTHDVADLLSSKAGHSHKLGSCIDFEQDDSGLFVPLESGGDASRNLVKRAEGDAALSIGCLMVEEMVGSGYANDVLDPHSNGTALRRAANMRGEGDVHQLFVDPALQLALERRITAA